MIYSIHRNNDGISLGLNSCKQINDETDEIRYFDIVGRLFEIKNPVAETKAQMILQIRQSRNAVSKQQRLPHLSVSLPFEFSNQSAANSLQF